MPGRSASGEKRTRTASLRRMEKRAASVPPGKAGAGSRPATISSWQYTCTGREAAGLGGSAPHVGAAPSTRGPSRSMGMGQPKWSRRALRVPRRRWPTVAPPWVPLALAVAARSCLPSIIEAATARERGHVSSSDHPRARA
eukprot:scaffold9517_cov117-Isochrysis_galbana.AAC.3